MNVSTYYARAHTDTQFAAGSVIPASDLTNEEYHRGPGLSKTGISRLGLSVEDFLSPVNEDKAIFAIGSALNDAVLHPQIFERSVFRQEIPKRNTKVGKAAWEALCEQLPGALVVKSKTTIDRLPGEAPVEGSKTLMAPEVYDEVIAMRDAILTRPISTDRTRKLGDLLESAVGESSYFAEDPETGLLVKCRPDAALPGVRLDLKTAHSADLWSFRNAAFRCGYHVQAAFYADVCSWATGEDPPRFGFIVVDKSDPRPEKVGLYWLPDHFVEEGRQIYRKTLNRFAEFLEREAKNPGQWTGYPIDFETVPLYRRESNEEIADV